MRVSRSLKESRLRKFERLDQSAFWVQGGALVAPPGVGGWEGERGCGVLRSPKGERGRALRSSQVKETPRSL